MSAVRPSEVVLHQWDIKRKPVSENANRNGHFFSEKYFGELNSITDGDKFIQFAQKTIKRLLASSTLCFYVWKHEKQQFEPVISNEALAPIISYQIEEGIIEWSIHENKILFLRPEHELNHFSKLFSGKMLVLVPLTIMGEPLGFFESVTRYFRQGTIREKKYYLKILQSQFSGLCASLQLKKEVREMNRIRGDIETQLLQSGKLIALGELVGGVAHEINNPMTTILGRIQILKMRHHLPQTLQQKLEIVEDEARRVTHIVRDLLNFSRKGSEYKRNEIVKINEVIKKSLDLTRHTLEVEGITIHLDLDPGTKEFLGNTNQWQQVFVNLFVNAQQALGREGHIFIKTRQMKKGLKISFKDNGPGIPKEIQKKIFDSFFTTKAGKGGTGLGLSITKKIVDSHGGTISVRNVQGKGAEFIITMPAKKEEEN
ncbi:sensor protein ZraS [bacterium BMS3Bbin03]|nr:sensor protein ZraS [bacterium BMS3Bbin03]